MTTKKSTTTKSDIVDQYLSTTGAAAGSGTSATSLTTNPGGSSTVTYDNNSSATVQGTQANQWVSGVSNNDPSGKPTAYVYNGNVYVYDNGSLTNYLTNNVGATDYLQAEGYQVQNLGNNDSAFEQLQGNGYMSVGQQAQINQGGSVTLANGTVLQGGYQGGSGTVGGLNGNYNTGAGANGGGGGRGGGGGGAVGAGGGRSGGGIGPNDNAMAVLQDLLNQWGLGSLAGKALQFLQQGYDQTAITYLLQQTPEYQQRFAGNAARIKAGLAPLSPSEYIATEASYRNIMRANGLPQGFYDKPTDFTQFIANDVSPQELNDRASTAAKFVQSTDPTMRDAFNQYYGIDAGHLTAYFLDPNRAMPLLQKQAGAAEIGGAALNQGLQATGKSAAELYADQGVTQSQAQSAYGTIAGILPDEQRIAERFGTNYNQQTAEQEMLGGLASAKRARTNLNQQEVGLFSGHGGVGSSFYHPDYAIAQDTSGGV